jgi:uridine kinase
VTDGQAVTDAETATDARALVLHAVARTVPRLGRPTLVGIDGVDGAGKTTFADALAAHLGGRPVLRVSVDDFHHPRATRHARGRLSPEGFWLDSFDYAALRSRVLNPVGPGGSRLVRIASHDLATDGYVDPDPVAVADDTVVIVDGLFLHRPELAGAWDVTVFLAVPFEVTVARMVTRDGAPPDVDDPANRRYVEAQRHYLATCSPAHRATLVVENSDPADPRVVSRP